ncbi:MAG: NUDIX domain-containing protein [Polyangiaceae bacterium]|jgi:isopentenyldiphosphate isomerase|nr:NUDIX domain-containing protein [Polyangiaceae bacterium]
MHDERFPLVDEEGRVIGSALRSQVHGNPALLHPVVHCLVTDPCGRVLLQLRSLDKDIQPGKWDTSVGGHVGWGEEVEDALRRELREEVGLEHVTPRFLYRYVMRSNIERELVYTYACVSAGPFTAQASEIDALRFWHPAEVEAALGCGVLTPNFEDEWKRFRSHRGAF